MITGLQVEFSVEELRAHLMGRADHHRDKAKFYANQVVALSEGMEANPGASNDPISSLRHSQREHESKAAFFTVLAEHLIDGETYRLSESDLTRTEIFARFF